MRRHFPITGFQADDLKKWERETPPAFPRTGREKGGEAGKSGVRVKNSPRTPASPPTPASPVSPPFLRALWKIVSFSRPALSRRRGKCHPPHHGPVQNP